MKKNDESQSSSHSEKKKKEFCRLLREDLSLPLNVLGLEGVVRGGAVADTEKFGELAQQSDEALVVFPDILEHGDVAVQYLGQRREENLVKDQGLEGLKEVQNLAKQGMVMLLREFARGEKRLALEQLGHRWQAFQDCHWV